jgi:rhodanese-related sulfurtransferase
MVQPMNIWIYALLAVLVVGFLVLPRLSWAKLSEAGEQLKSGAVLVDVRTPGEFQGGSANGAVNIPLGSVETAVKEKGWSMDKPILLFCASGTRSAVAVKQLKALGYAKAVNLGTVGRARALKTDRRFAWRG